MQDDDDELDGATLIKPQEDAGDEFDLPGSDEGPGTFVMTQDHHASRADPASPFARESQGSDAGLAAWNHARAPYASQPDDPMAMATARSMMGGPAPAPPGNSDLSPEVAALPLGAHPAANLPPRPLREPRSTLSTVLTSAAIGLGTVVVVVGGYLLVRSDESAPPDQPPQPAPIEAPPAAPTQAASEQAPAPLLTEADKAAIEALELLRTGVDACATKKIRALPGTSVAIPSSFQWLKHGAYEPMNTDFSGPFFSCTGFFLKGPMSYVVQWQLGPDSKRGEGVAWVDDNHDGTPERAWIFHATWKSATDIDVTEIEKTDASFPMQKPR